MRPIKIDLTTKQPKIHTITTWVNIYKNGCAYGYPSMEEAREATHLGRAIVVAFPLEITYEEKE